MAKFVRSIIGKNKRPDPMPARPAAPPSVGVAQAASAAHMGIPHS